MIEVELPTDDETAALVRSFAACLASVTEAELGDVPLPSADFHGATAHWRSWLASLGFGLVPIAQPRKFHWPGYWLAVLGDAKAVLMFGTPSGVVLSPQDASLLGQAAEDLRITEGYAVARLDPALSHTSTTTPVHQGTTDMIALAESATAPMHSVQHAHALAGRGLDGDRYAAKEGTFTPDSDAVRGYDLTLIEAEVLDRLPLPNGSALEPVDARRNIVTRGIDLNALVGRRFRIGDVECLGQRLCEPCSHLERLTVKGVLRPLIHRGGLRADVLSDGDIAVGSTIETLD